MILSQKILRSTFFLLGAERIDPCLYHRSTITLSELGFMLLQMVMFFADIDEKWHLELTACSAIAFALSVRSQRSPLSVRHKSISPSQRDARAIREGFPPLMKASMP